MPENQDRKILVVDDEQDMRWILAAVLEDHGYQVFTAEDGKIAMKMIRKEQPDLVVTDIKMPNMDGMELLRRARESAMTMPVIMMTAYGDVSTAVEAMKLGAYDYLIKPFDNEEMILAIQRALRGHSLEEEVERLRVLLGEKKDLSQVMGKSSTVQELGQQVKRVAASDFSVLVEGESGTGKEVIAEAIHLNSGRSEGPFTVVDCGAIPETLIESELFGYEKGAFTGAHRRKEGLFEVADSGTLFLDEISNLPMSMQPKLLRAIQSKEVIHLGGTKRIQVDIRVISASNQGLLKAVEKGTFRQDLYYRLTEFTVEVPPLRERRDDILYLAHLFLRKVCKQLNKKADGFSKQAEKLMLIYDWPGNVRELKNVVRRAALLADRIITPKMLPIEVREFHRSVVKFDDLDGVMTDGLTWKDLKKRNQSSFEKRVLTTVLRRTDGNKRQAALLLKMDYKTLHTKVKELGIDVSRGE